MTSKVDALYEAAQKATPGPRIDLHLDYGMEELDWVRPDRTHVEVSDDDWRLIVLADRETVMALVEVYRAAGVFVLNERWIPHAMNEPMRTRYEQARAAIEKVEALG